MPEEIQTQKDITKDIFYSRYERMRTPSPPKITPPPSITLRWDLEPRRQRSAPKDVFSISGKYKPSQFGIYLYQTKKETTKKTPGFAVGPGIRLVEEKVAKKRKKIPNIFNIF